MNKSERIAFEWLIKEKGLTESEIIFSGSKTPDFLCKNGKKYEVKRLYGNSILVYQSQVSDLKGSEILVVNTEKEQVFLVFPWDSWEDIHIPKIRFVDYQKGKVSITVKRETAEMLSKEKSYGESWDELLLRLAKGEKGK